MDSETVAAVTEWDTVPAGTGYDGLHDLADAEFTGAVTAGDTWGFMLNGRLVGIVDGSLATFDAASLTAYEAPTPALPLLYTMQSQDNEKQAEYYTNETAIADADSTLAGGNFTGYIELSENVLSGDYYVVYYGGRSMSVAFLGNSRRLLTDEEAFERANDEVGIYDVYAADIDVIDLPEREPSSPTDSEPTPTTDESSTDSNAPPADSNASGASADGSDSPSTAGSTDRRRRGAIDIPQAGGDDSAAEPPTAGSDTDPTDGPSTTTADTDPTDGPSTTDDDGIDPTGVTADADGAGSAAGDTDSSPGGSTAAADTDSGGTTAATDAPTTDAATNGPSEPGANAEPFQEEAAWRNTTTIPSLDPTDDESSVDTTSHDAGGGQQAITRSDDRLSRQQLRQRLEKAEEVMEKAEQRHEQLIAERDDAQDARAAAEERVAELEAELADARERIEELETDLDATAPAATSAATRTMDAATALAGTNLFVRYDSKGEATLADAYEGAATKEAVAANIRLDHHTTFDTEGLQVAESPFEAFLEDRIEVAFAEWLVTDLLFELRATGATTALSAVADAIPEIDRIELHGTIEVGTDEDDEPIERTFDCVVRDKRGTPLCVANFDASKQPVGADMVEHLIRDGNDLRAQTDSFAAAFAVTSSYFTEDAYEMADDATGSGLFSRSGGKSFVNISRKQGFHLCLVDRIKGGFELQKPEL